MTAGQLFLPAVVAAVERLGHALAHADRMGGMDHSAAVSVLVSEMGTGLDSAMRDEADLGIDPGVVEWIVTAPTQAETVARAVVWITEMALDIDEYDHHREDGEPIPPGSIIARAALLLSLQCSTLTHDGTGR